MKRTRKVLLCLVVMAGILILLSSFMWSPSDTLIKQDFESYWRKTSEVLDNLVLVDMKVVDKSIGVFTAEVMIACVGKKRERQRKGLYRKP